MATIREVSRLARVSPATVSRVLNGTTPVAPPTRERVLQAVAALDYTPNAFARGLATNRSGGIGLTVNEVSSPYFGAFIAGVEQVAREHDLHLMVSSGFAQAETEHGSIEFLLGRRCDGLVVQAEGLPDEDLIELVRGGPTPVVVFGRSVAEIEDVCIVMKNEPGGALATEHLLAHGHRRIAHVSGPLSFPDARERLHGYRRALEAAGLEYDERYVVESTFLEEGGARATARLLERVPELTAIFFARPDLSEDEALRRLAAPFGDQAANIAEFWRQTSAAMERFPWEAAWFIRKLGRCDPRHSMEAASIRERHSHTPSWVSTRNAIFMKTDDTRPDPWLLEDVQLRCDLAARHLTQAVALGERLAPALAEPHAAAMRAQLKELAGWRRCALSYVYHIRETNLTALIRRRLGDGRAVPATAVRELREILQNDADNGHPAAVAALACLDADVAEFTRKYFVAPERGRMAQGGHSLTSR